MATPSKDTPQRTARTSVRELRGLQAVTPSPRPDQYELPPPDPAVQGIKVLPVSISLLLTLNPFLVETNSTSTSCSDEEYLPLAPQQGRGGRGRGGAGAGANRSI